MYCVGNPVKLIDTDGKDIFLPGNKKAQDAYVKMLYTSNLQLSPERPYCVYTSSHY